MMLVRMLSYLCSHVPDKLGLVVRIPSRSCGLRTKPLLPFLAMPRTRFHQPRGPSRSTDSLLPKKFEAVRDYSRTKSWEEVARLPQGILDAPEDVFLPIKTTDADGKETSSSGARAEATATPGRPRAGYEATLAASCNAWSTPLVIVRNNWRRSRRRAAPEPRPRSASRLSTSTAVVSICLWHISIFLAVDQRRGTDRADTLSRAVTALPVRANAEAMWKD